MIGISYSWAGCVVQLRIEWNFMLLEVELTMGHIYVIMSSIYFLQEIPQMLFHPTVGQISSQCQIRIAEVTPTCPQATTWMSSSTTPNNQLQPWDPTTANPQQQLQRLQRRRRRRYLLPTTATLPTPTTTIHKSTPTSTTITNNCKKSEWMKRGPKRRNRHLGPM